MSEATGLTEPRSAGDIPRPVLVLSLVHPDFLPSVYALALAMKDACFDPTIVSFSTLGPGRYHPGSDITLIDCGPHIGSAADRQRARARFRTVSTRAFGRLSPIALIATCPFSYLEALRLARGRPVLYFVEEIHEVNRQTFLRSPLTAWRNWRAERRLGEATLVAAPSDERASFIASSARLSRRPATVLNCPYISQDAGELDDRYLETHLPRAFFDSYLVINTGRVSANQGILELVTSVQHWPGDSVLVVTGVDDSPYSRQVKAAVEKSPRRTSICLLPLIPRAAMLALQRRAHVGICLLRKEADPATRMPAPNKVGEYLRWGLFVVASRLPFLDQLQPRNVGALVDEFDPIEIGRAVEVAVGRARDPQTRLEVQRVSRTWLNMSVQAAPIIRVLEMAARSNLRALRSRAG